MRKILLAVAAAGISASGLFAGGANAMAIMSPNDMRAAAETTDLIQDVGWVCRYRDWGGRRCFWVTPGVSGAYGYQPYYRSPAYQPYYRNRSCPPEYASRPELCGR